MIDIRMQPTQTEKQLTPNIMVIGVGGAGCNAVNNMMASDLDGCDFLSTNTDAQSLENSLADPAKRIQLGMSITGGLGAGSKPEIGRAAAEESLEEVMAHLEGANMAFVTAGMGGGTGTGAAPVIAKACRDRGILTIGVVTKPFHFEGSHRMKSAEAGLEEMQQYVDTLIVIPNQNLFRVANENTTFADAFQMADSVLKAGVQGVTDLMVRPGLVNLDFADIRTAMLEQGKAMMGTGESAGEKRAIEAAESAINNPLLDDVSMKGANGVIINVTGGFDMTLFEADEACNRIRDEVDPDANIIFGATFDQNLEGKMRVSIVATGIEKEAEKAKFSGGSGGVGGNVMLQRAQPNTQQQAPQQQQQQTEAPVNMTAQQQPVFMPAQSIPGAHVHAIKPPPNVRPQIETNPGAPAQDPEADLFEQSEFAASEANTALRGTRYKDAFIPPKPIEAPREEAAAQAFHTQSQVPQQAQVRHQPLFQQSPQKAVQGEPASSLQLNPPRLPVSEPKKRTPSLFERITGTVQEHIEGITNRTENAPQQRQAQPRKAPSATAQPQQQPKAQPQMRQQTQVQQQPPKAAPPLSQGSLNIDAPSKPAVQGEEEGDFDIPAFLRRQAN